MANTTKLQIAVAQLNPTVGAVADNADLLRTARRQAKNADIVVASELFLSGYPPEDLVLKRAFLRHVAEQIDALVEDTKAGGPALIFGAPVVEDGQLYNSVVVADGGQCTVRHKVHLPNYSVFDENRLFTSGAMPQIVELRGVRLGLPICEDIWFADVCAHLQSAGAELLISLNSSPFERDKYERRMGHARARVKETGLPLIYVNQIGGQDELVFDGGSFVLGGDGAMVMKSAFWKSETTLINWTKTDTGWQGVALTNKVPFLIETVNIYELLYEQIYLAAIIGLRDYVRKNNFTSVLLGLSGGIDSALCAAIAVDALGAGRVRGIMMPSRYTSKSSLADARACAKMLGIKLDEVPIIDAVDVVETSLADLFARKKPDVTEENIQSRLRGLLLMAMSNKFGAMLVTTGNKSEISVGYATLYGDMNGGYNPIKDIYKTEVFALAGWRNTHFPDISMATRDLGTRKKPPNYRVIPQAIIDKPPSAELRPDQKDEDSLPPYEMLDDILFALIEEEASIDDIAAHGSQGFSTPYTAQDSKSHALAVVKRVEHLLYVSEYKRRQAAPGTKIGSRNFGRDRRYPITNGFREGRTKQNKQSKRSKKNEY